MYTYVYMDGTRKLLFRLNVLVVCEEGVRALHFIIF